MKSMQEVLQMMFDRLQADFPEADLAMCFDAFHLELWHVALGRPTCTTAIVTSAASV